MPLAIGGSSAAKPPHGVLWVDVRDYGARADNGVTDNSIPFQAAIDDLGAKLLASQFAKGVVFIPSAPQSYLLKKSVWVDHDGIEIRGEGWGSMVVMQGPLKHSVFIFGVRRVEQAVVNGTTIPLQIDTSNRPDLFGKLDTSAVSSPGTNWGLRTNGNTFAQFHASPICAGVSAAANASYSDNWSETSKLTVEFCIEPPDGQQFPGNAPLLGIGGFDPIEPSPFVLKNWDTPNKVLVMFRTSEMDPGPNGLFRSFSFSLSGATAPYRVALQFDIDNAACSVFVNGVQVALADQNNLSPTAAAPFTPGSGLKFATNEHYPFKIGANGLAGPFGGGTGVDLRLYGLRLSNTIRYQNNGVGKPQVRADSPATPINDAWAYFGQDANTICYLPFSDSPATAGRVVAVQHGGAVSEGLSSGLFLHSTDLHHVTNTAIRDILLECSTGYGQAISVGAVFELTIENVKAFGGYNGVGSFNMATNYFIYVRNCNLDGLDSPYYGAYQLMFATDVVFASAGRVTVRHLGTGARWENVFVLRSSPVTECVFKARGTDLGGGFMLTNWMVDFEGDTLSRAAIYCEAHGQASATSLSLKNIFLGTVGGGASLVQLKDTYYENGAIHKCWLSVDNLQAYTSNYLAAFDVDGPLWHGEVKGVALTGPRLYHRQKWGTGTSLVLYETKYTAPPRELNWYNGAHVLEVRSPSDGQYLEWRCVASGAYGTSQPPVWAGLNPLTASANGLAAYVLNHAYINVALS